MLADVVCLPSEAAAIGRNDKTKGDRLTIGET